MPAELRLQIIDAELLRRSAADLGLNGGFDGDALQEDGSSAEQSEQHSRQPEPEQQQGEGPWWNRLTAGQSEQPRVYLEAQGSKADVQPGRGVYRRREKYDAAVKKLREESNAAVVGGNQYILGVAGGADSVASQLAGGAVGGSILEEEEAAGLGGLQEENEAQDQRDQFDILLDSEEDGFGLGFAEPDTAQQREHGDHVSQQPFDVLLDSDEGDGEEGPEERGEQG